MTRLQWLMKYLDKAVALHSKSSTENLILIKVRKYNQEKNILKRISKLKYPMQFEVLVLYLRISITCLFQFIEEHWAVK